MTCTSDYQPLWRPQNPALSGDPNGWKNCAAYVGGFAADYSTCGIKQPTGAYVRSLTNEPVPDPLSPGLNIYQVTDALAKLGVTVSPFVRATWAEVIGWWQEGRYVSLCGGYSVIRPTRFSGDPNFYGGHQIGVPGTLKAEDPLADGRRAGIYKYHGEVYPVSLLRAFAGAFQVRSGAISHPIGLGYAQGFHTHANPHPVTTHTLYIATGVTSILTANISGSCIASWTKHPWSGVASSAPCQAAVYRKGCSSGGATTAYVTAGVFAGKHVRIGNGVSVT